MCWRTVLERSSSVLEQMRELSLCVCSNECTSVPMALLQAHTHLMPVKNFFLLLLFRFFFFYPPRSCDVTRPEAVALSCHSCFYLSTCALLLCDLCPVHLTSQLLQEANHTRADLGVSHTHSHTHADLLFTHVSLPCVFAVALDSRCPSTWPVRGQRQELCAASEPFEKAHQAFMKS